MAFVWKDSYSVGKDAIDKQHQKLFAINDRIYNALRDGRGREEVQSVVSELIAYTRTHFSQEEALFQRTAYPDVEAHLNLHRDFVARLETIQKEQAQDPLRMSQEIMKLVQSWLLQHILKVDKGYSTYL